ncbi:hypothetical protein YC2023_070653 [Brassica napus]
MAAMNSSSEKKEEGMDEKGGEVSGCSVALPLGMSLDVSTKGQLGHGDMIQRDRPTVVSGLSKHKIVKAGAGRSHTVVVSDDGRSFAFGLNKHGQLGLGTAKNGFVSVEVESSPLPCVVSDEVTNIACGAEFTVWLSSTEGSTILTAGLPQYGQLGHGTDHEPRPKAIASLAGETIVKVACGTNHTDGALVDMEGWLGHREQKDEWSPRRVDVFQIHFVLPPNAIVSAGSANSFCTGGQLYMWGKVKNNGENWTYPKPMMDLSGWNLRCMDSGSLHHFVGAESSCISWGHHAQNGELGYGLNGQKSSVAPKKVDILEGMHVMGVACESVEPKEETVATMKQQPAKRGASKKMKASKASSDFEQDSNEENSEDGEEANGKKQGARGRGRGRGRRGRGGRTGSGKASPVKTGGRRGRPRGGQLYMWGKIKNNGDDWIGWNLRWMDSGSMHHFVGADSSCISWGHAQYGELGYGPNGQKSSAAPKKVDLLEGMHVMGVACGLSHSMVIVDRTDVADRLEQLEIYDGKGSLEESVEPKEEAVATTKQKPAKRGASKKRKASKASSDSDEENSDKEKEAQGSDSDYSDDDGEEEANGKKQRTPRRGRGRGGRGRGGRTGNGKASPVEEEVDLASLRNHSDSKKESTWSIFQQFSSLSSHNEMLRKTFLITVSNICLSFTGLCILM